MMRFALLLMIFGSLGCGDGGGSATVRLQFTASGSARSSASLVDELRGFVYGSIYLTEEVTLTGPIDGAVPVASLDAGVEIDLVANDTSVADWIGELPPGRYTFLGFFDVDGNGADTRDPESGDPVTLPNVNRFELVAGDMLDYVVTFDLVL